MPSVIEYDFRELEELSNRVGQGSAIIKVTLNDGLRALGRLIVPAKGTGPLAAATPRVTGKLQRSTFFQITGSGIRQVLTVLQPARTPEGEFYGQFVREGTRPHVIRPRKAKALRFEMAGETVYAMQVNHPGTTANQYHKRVMVQLRSQVQGIVNKMGERVSAFISGK